MKKLNQKGFSPVGILVVVVIVGLIGTVGWLVYDRQKDNGYSSQQPSQLTSRQSQANNVEEYMPPNGWVQHKGSEFGLSFYYPKNWDPNSIKVKQYGKDEAIRSGYGTPDSVVFVGKSNTWVRFLNYGESDENGNSLQKPIEPSENDEYSLTIVNRTNYKYPFAYLKLGHAATARYDIYLATDVKSYAISLPPINTFESTEEEWKEILSEQDSSIPDIIQSIRFSE